MSDIKKLFPANGVCVYLMPSDRFKTSVVSVNLAMPLDGRVEERAILSSLLRRCSQKYDDMTKMNRKLASLYGAVLGSAVTKKGEAQLVTFSLTSVDDKFAMDNEKIGEESLKLLIELLFEPKLVQGVFLREDIETEKRLLIEKIDSEFSEKRIYALTRAEEEMCKNERFATKRYGNKERISSLTAEDVTKAWKEMLEKAIIQINIVGNVDASNIGKELEERFAKIDRSELCEISTEFVVSADQENYVCEKQAVKQGKLVIGLRAGMTDKDDNNFVLSIFTDVFGGGPYSKLFMNVREKMSLCYYCSARYNRQKGIIMIQSGIEQENEQKAISAIKAQLEDMKNGNFTKEDLENSIKGITDSLLAVSDSPESIDSWYSGQYTSVGEDELLSPEQFAQNIKNVTVQQVQAAAQNVTVDTIYMLKPNGEEAQE